jgi:hypothetical protein
VPPASPGCNFINLHVRSIHPKERKVDLNEGGSVAIASGIDAENAASAQIREPTASTKVRLSRNTVISPAVRPIWRSLPPRAARTRSLQIFSASSGLCQIVYHTKPSAPAITLASGIAEIRSNVSFRVRVINPTHRAHSLSKGMVIGLAAHAPARVSLWTSMGPSSVSPRRSMATHRRILPSPIRRRRPLSPVGPPGCLCPPKVCINLSGGNRSVGIGQQSIPLRWTKKTTSMKSKPSRRKRDTRK